MQRSPSTDTLLRADELELSTSGKFKLGPLSLRLAHGEHTAIIGPSGSGKSTLLRLLTGNQIPSDGSVYVQGRQRIAANQLIAGFTGIKLIFQEPDLPAFQRIRASLERELAYLSDSHRTLRIETLSKRFDIGDFLTQKPEELSVGQRQRCAIALAFASKPKLLALDEAFSSQDAWRRQLLLEAVRKEALESDTTLLVCTHSVKEAFYLCRKVLVLNEGQVLFGGSLSKLPTVDLPQVQALFGWVSEHSPGKWARLQLDDVTPSDMMKVEAIIRFDSERIAVGKLSKSEATAWVPLSDSVSTDVLLGVSPTA